MSNPQMPEVDCSNENLYLAGEMKELTAAYNWADTVLGPIGQWPLSLKTLVNLTLSSSLPMFLWWGDQNIQFYNDAYRKILGCDGKHPAALGQKGMDCWPEIWDIIHPLIQLALAGKSPSSENQLIPIYRNGKIEDVYWTYTYSPVNNDSGTINGVLVTCNETTQKVLSEKHASRQISNLFIQAPVGICILRGRDYIIEMVNTSMIEIWARKIEDVLNKPAFKVLPELNDQGFKELLDSVMDTGERFVAQQSPISLVRNGNMENVFVKFVYEPLREEDGTITGIMALAHEVTDMVMAMKKIADAEQKALIAIDSADMGVYEIDLLTMGLLGDKRFFELLGLENNATLADAITLLNPEDILDRRAAYKEALITGKMHYEARVMFKDKSFHWVKINGNIFYNKNKEAVKMLGVIDDITEHKLLQRQKDDFLSLASHELKTPVTTIKAYGQLAETIVENKGDLITLNLLKKMGGQVKKLTSLIDSLLDITRIQQGQLVFNESVFNFDDFVADIVEDMQKVNPLHTIKVNLYSCKEIFGDAERLGQVLINLISNSVKYSPGKTTILIVTKADKDGILLSVQDNGIGIATESLTEVFKQFYRVDNKNGFSGMGIGLYISAEIVRRHNGKIWADSLLDHGATFKVWVPLDYRQAQLPILNDSWIDV